MVINATIAGNAIAVIFMNVFRKVWNILFANPQRDRVDRLIEARRTQEDFRLQALVPVRVIIFTILDAKRKYECENIVVSPLFLEVSESDYRSIYRSLGCDRPAFNAMLFGVRLVVKEGVADITDGSVLDLKVLQTQ